jgi:hypothetical protein
MIPGEYDNDDNVRVAAGWSRGGGESRCRPKERGHGIGDSKQPADDLPTPRTTASRQLGVYIICLYMSPVPSHEGRGTSNDDVDNDDNDDGLAGVRYAC